MPARRLPELLGDWRKLAAEHQGLATLLGLLLASTVAALLFLVGPLVARRDPVTPPRERFSRPSQWTRLQPIRTAAEVPLEFAVFTRDAFTYQRIGAEAGRMRRLGMSLRAIGRALGVDEKTVRNTIAQERPCRA